MTNAQVEYLKHLETKRHNVVEEENVADRNAAEAQKADAAMLQAILKGVDLGSDVISTILKSGAVTNLLKKGGSAAAWDKILKTAEAQHNKMHPDAPIRLAGRKSILSKLTSLGAKFGSTVKTGFESFKGFKPFVLFEPQKQAILGNNKGPVITREQ